MQMRLDVGDPAIMSNWWFRAGSGNSGELAGAGSRDYAKPYLSAFYHIKGIIHHRLLKQYQIFHRASGFYLMTMHSLKLHFR
jgi:hypothetical protein